jgi:hypothetical protein
MSLPKCKIEGVLLKGRGASLLSLIHVLWASVRKLPVVLKAPNAEINIAFRLISMV